MSRPYQNSLFGCCSPFGLCLKATCCNCFVVGRNHHRITRGNDADYGSCNGWCVGWCALQHCGLGFILQMMDRGDMREKYNLEGSGCGDCCKSFCCSCCEAIQTSKELDYVQIEQQPGKGYMPQQGMVAAPQQQYQ